jgi:hypothetical protein
MMRLWCIVAILFGGALSVVINFAVAGLDDDNSNVPSSSCCSSFCSGDDTTNRDESGGEEKEAIDAGRSDSIMGDISSLATGASNMELTHLSSSHALSRGYLSIPESITVQFNSDSNNSNRNNLADYPAKEENKDRFPLSSASLTPPIERAIESSSAGRKWEETKKRPALAADFGIQQQVSLTDQQPSSQQEEQQPMPINAALVSSLVASLRSRAHGLKEDSKERAKFDDSVRFIEMTRLTTR